MGENKVFVSYDVGNGAAVLEISKEIGIYAPDMRSGERLGNAGREIPLRTLIPLRPSFERQCL